MLRSVLLQVLVPRQSLQLSTFSCLSTKQEHILTKFRSNCNIGNCKLHVSSQLLDKQYDSDPFANIKECDNPSLNPTLHQQKVNDRRSKRNGKVLNVAILGIPNSGKSTLINKFVGKEVCPYSCKSQTTRRRSRAIYTEDDTQIVFLDTPVLHDVSNRFVREAIDPKILRLLCKYQHRVPSILVLNKIDILATKRRIFDLICKLTCNRLDDGRKSSVQINRHEPKWNVESYLKRIKRQAKYEGKEETKEDLNDKSFQAIFEEAARGPVVDVRAAELTKGLLGWPGFRDVFTISAKNGDGVADLKNYIINNAKPGGHRFSADIVHDQDPRQTVVDIIKSKLLDNLEREVPFNLQPVIQMWQYDEEKKMLNIGVSIETRNSREAKQLIGVNGETIRLLSHQMEASLMDYFDTVVALKLEAKLAKSEADKLSFEAIRNPTLS